MSGAGEFIAVPPSEPVDLTNCDREPIHIPGSIQPHGALLAVRADDDLTVVQVSANAGEALGYEPAAAIGRPLREVFGEAAAKMVRDVVRTAFDLREASPVDLTLGDGDDLRRYDALLHRVGGQIVVELQPARSARPLSYSGTYARTRQSVLRLNGSRSLADLYDVVVEEVRRLTGFDRVMVYRFDAEWNGEVVAEAKTGRLNSFRGLRYPATDIPAQARALYERSWLRLIPDVDYRPVPLVPAVNAVTGGPLDLGDAWLRSVSPIHLEYLKNMGVTASMSISLLRDGRLWGLIACHHYSGPHEPGYEICAAAEFLGHLFSLRLVSRENEQILESTLATRQAFDRLLAEAQGDGASLVDVLTAGGPNLADLISCGGVAVAIDGEYRTFGAVPPRQAQRAAFDALATEGAILACDALPRDAPHLAEHRDVACGMLAFRLSGDEGVAWFRPETVRTVDWGGDPHNKELIAREGAGVRLSPRRSFDRWREVVRGRARPWSAHDLAIAGELRQHLLRLVYPRARHGADLARLMQESLLPERLPSIPGFEIEAWYDPAAAGRVGGDWYDAVPLPDGRVAVIVGDVAGHGVAAAGTMAQLRNALRAYVVDLDPAEPRPARAVLDRLDRLAAALLPQALATVAVAVTDPATGLAQVASSGHPPPLVLPAVGEPVVVEVETAPPVGAAIPGPAPARFSAPGDVPAGAALGEMSAGRGEGGWTAQVRLAPGDVLALYSDGLTERRTEAPDVGIERLRTQAASALAARPDLRGLGDSLFRTCRDPDNDDDATLLLLRRRPAGPR
ncbi:SpoIIE family protein phosphatase [Frankia sp. QA3]|uniref:SpoIIE family protein phosphatase n=1 Tax=Frankia sp. QA3 TaxID=710111 RepID=UPI000269CF3B|nr:SpoIIE family protein phosphatase [Frankia sp. QA3]EIV96312.1 bacteriophytochrome (light-regulated signal transduction histidine kinase) [Frankia sp. QA3]